MTPTKLRILVVDDERNLNQLVATNLMLEGYEVHAAYSGNEALEMLPKLQPDLVLLDVMMPGLDGFEVLQHIRQFSSVPVIMLTARGRVEERIKGLSQGADDYIAKPFSIEELMARIAAVVRRLPDHRKEPQVEEIVSYGDLSCNAAKHVALAGGKELQLQNLEFRLLSAFLRAGDRVLTYEYLLTTLWDADRGDIATLRVTIGKLRAKIKQALGRDVITTVHGIGYRLTTSATPQKESDASDNA